MDKSEQDFDTAWEEARQIYLSEALYNVDCNTAKQQWIDVGKPPNIAAFIAGLCRA